MLSHTVVWVTAWMGVKPSMRGSAEHCRLTARRLGFISPLPFYSSSLQHSQDMHRGNRQINSKLPFGVNVSMFVYVSSVMSSQQGVKSSASGPKDKRTGATITHEENLRGHMTLCCLYCLAHVEEGNTIKSSWYTYFRICNNTRIIVNTGQQ